MTVVEFYQDRLSGSTSRGSQPPQRAMFATTCQDCAKVLAPLAELDPAAREVLAQKYMEALLAKAAMPERNTTARPSQHDPTGTADDTQWRAGAAGLPVPISVWATQHSVAKEVLGIAPLVRAVDSQRDGAPVPDGLREGLRFPREVISER